MSKLECCFKCFLISCKSFFIAFGGVLSVLALTLIPSHVSAYSEPIKIPSNDTSYRMNINHNIYAGCAFRDYELLNGSNPYLGSLLDGTHNCGYRFSSNSNSVSYYDQSRNAYSLGTYNGSSFTFSQQELGGYNILNSWNSTALQDHGQNIYNTLNNIQLTLQKCPANISSCSEGINLSTSITGNAIFVYAYKSPLVGSVGTTPRIQHVGSGFGVYNSSGSYLDTDHFDYSDYADQISDSIVYGSFNSEQLQNLLPDNLQYMNLGDEYMYIIGSIPTSSDYYLKTTSLYFYPEKGIKYNWQLASSVPITGVQGGVLNMDNQFNFLQYPVGGSYKNQGVSISDFALSDAKFTISICTTTDECSYYSNFDSMYRDWHSSATNQPSGAGGSQNLFMSWFDVFNFGFTFPFRNFFQAFTDSTSCVSVPIIGGMLHNPNATYCSWWSPNIRSVLTPVFSLAGLMILTGLIMHWLGTYHGSETIKTKRSER